MKQMFSLRFDKSLLERMRLFIKKDGCGEADKLQNAAGYQ